MANTKTSKPRQEHILIDSAPVSAGAWTNPVNPGEKKVPNLYFSIRETGDGSDAFTATVTMQWRQKNGDTWEEWQVYDTYTVVTRKIVEDHSAEVQYRAGVDDGDYTSGELTVGFNW